MIREFLILLPLGAFISIGVQGTNNIFSERTLLSGTVVRIEEKAAMFSCGTDGYTIIELESGVREKICGKYGDVGEHISLFR